MKKILIQYMYIFAILLIVLLLTGCTNKNASNAPGSKKYMDNVVDGLSRLGSSGTLPK